MGKRCDFTARTVIGGDVNLNLDEIGIPMEIAMQLTIPEKITQYNIEKIKKLINNGPNIYPGCTTITRLDGIIIDLKYSNKSLLKNVEIGYVVERHLQDNDIVIFNRQPTLHKMSMMAHRIKVLPFSTFRMNICATSPYNADFDGDEMNLHIPQDINSITEAKYLMSINDLIVSPQSNAPVIGIVQDALLGIYLLTKKNTFLNKRNYHLLIGQINKYYKILPAIVTKGNLYYTGKQIFSCILNNISSNINYQRKCDSIDNTEQSVLISNSYLLTGQLDKKSIGKSSGSIIHMLFNDYGSSNTKDFIFYSQKVATAFLNIHGSTVSIEDVIINKKYKKDINQIYKNANKEVNYLLEEFKQMTLERLPGFTLQETFELKVNQLLNKSIDKTSNLVMKGIKKNNWLNVLVSCGSKGNNINICQIIGCLGQQNVAGKRIPNGYKNRSLPHFTKEDAGSKARGFIKNSYIKGLNPHEMFFHAMGGREGLVDTACKTAAVGYIQRRMIKRMEDVSVTYNGLVTNSKNEIIQFLYGEDGVDGVGIEIQKIEENVIS